MWIELLTAFLNNYMHKQYFTARTKQFLNCEKEHVFGRGWGGIEVSHTPKGIDKDGWEGSAE
jgi:hypothetical protein